MLRGPDGGIALFATAAFPTGARPGTGAVAPARGGGARGGLRVTGYQVKVVTLRIGADDYRVRSLSDRQQFFDPDGQAEGLGISSATWPLFGVTWPAGIALAEEMSDFPIDGKRILEVGCGLGLSSLVLQRRGADVTACDYHPVAEEFLRQNCELNGLAPIPFVRAPWEGPNPGLGRFDLIVGSDLLYERDHAELLSGFLERHANPAAEVIIADPGRPYCGRFARLMIAQGYARSDRGFRASGGESPLPRGRIMAFSRAAG
jgi:predicted nicotinamide N-methyase